MGVITTGKGGIIYAALFSDGLVKIGCTRNEKRRMATLSSSGPHKLLRFISAESHDHNLLRDEASFHELFAHKRVHGEYFAFDFVDWLEWFSQWNCVEWANEQGLLADLAQFYDAAEHMLAPDFLKAVAKDQPCNVQSDDNSLEVSG